ncbi:MAG: winged helix-turn-helix transcriptional regulator [Clostridia bacterium]|nr:winged helix-turn-helix transcriptional regulator [Clostridia bacterium]
MPSGEGLERVCNMFRVLAEPSRMKIVLALKEGELCVYHIVEACGGTQSAVSHQLRVLKDNRVIKCRREGQNVLYSLADAHILKILEMSEEHMSCGGEI